MGEMYSTASWIWMIGIGHRSYTDASTSKVPLEYFNNCVMMANVLLPNTSFNLKLEIIRSCRHEFSPRSYRPKISPRTGKELETARCLWNVFWFLVKCSASGKTPVRRLLMQYRFHRSVEREPLGLSAGWQAFFYVVTPPAPGPAQRIPTKNSLCLSV